jgi:hypothetical protein
VAYFDQLDFGFAKLGVDAKGYVGREERINLDAENVVSINLKRKAFLKFEGPTLVEYDRQEELEGVIKLVISEFIGREREVYLVSTGSILGACKGEQVRVVDFSSTMPEDLESMLEEIPAGGALLFEAITELIHRVGLDEALSFMEKTVNYLTKEGLNIVAFINRGAHGEKITAMFEKFFLSIAEVRDGGLVETDIEAGGARDPLRRAAGQKAISRGQLRRDVFQVSFSRFHQVSVSWDHPKVDLIWFS